MAALEIRRGRRAPLFERLVDDAPHEPGRSDTVRTLTGSMLTESISREVSRLLNTRCAYTLDELAARPRTVLEYGLPDLSNYYAGGDESEALLAKTIGETIEAYEPRLRDVRVDVVGADRRRSTLEVRIAGDQGVQFQVEAVSFPIVIHEFEALETAELEDPDAGTRA